MNRLDVLGNLPIHMFQQGDAFLLPFAFITLSIDPAGTGIEGGKEVESASACVLMLIPIGPVLRLRWPSRGRAADAAAARSSRPAESTISSARRGRV